MKKRTLVVILAVASMLAGVVGVSAQIGITELPGGGWWEASLVMNAGTADATVSYEPIPAADSTDTDVDPVTETIAQGASLNFMVGQWGNLPSIDDGFKGSVIVSADQPILAIGSVANNLIGDIGVSGGRAAAQYPGISQDAVATTMAFPVVKNNYTGKTTTFYIQTVEPGTVNVVYTMNDGANTYNDSHTTTVAGQMVTFTPSDVATMPSGCSGSDHTCLGAATFSSSVELAGVYAEHNTTEPTVGQILLSTRGFTADDYDTTVVNPVIKSCWVGRTTGMQVMNVGGAASTITVTLAYQDGSATGADGAVITYDNVAVGASVTYFPGNHTADDTLLGPFGGCGANEFVGAATVTSDQDMVAIVNENDFAAAGTTKQTVFACFPQSAGTDTVLYPLAKEFYNGNTTGIQIMNVGANAVTLEADYVLQNNSFTVDVDSGGSAITIQPGGAFTFWGVTNAYWNSGAYTAYTGDYGAVTVNATGTGTPMIVGIAQEAENPAGGLGYLDTKNYEGFNQ